MELAIAIASLVVALGGVVYSAGMQGQRVRTCERDLERQAGELLALRAAHVELATKTDLKDLKTDLLRELRGSGAV